MASLCILPNVSRMYPNHPQAIPNSRMGGNPSKLYFEANITITPKPDRNKAEKENYSPISLMIIDAELLKTLANRIQQNSQDS